MLQKLIIDIIEFNYDKVLWSHSLAIGGDYLLK